MFQFLKGMFTPTEDPWLQKMQENAEAMQQHSEAIDDLMDRIATTVLEGMMTGEISKFSTKEEVLQLIHPRQATARQRGEQ